MTQPQAAPQGHKPPPISLVHSQSEARRRECLHSAVQNFKAYQDMQHARQKQAVRTAYLNGKAHAEAKHWWDGFYTGATVFGALSAITVIGFVAAAKWGLTA